MLRRFASPSSFDLFAALIVAACGGYAANGGATGSPARAATAAASPSIASGAPRSETSEASLGGALAEALVAKLQADPFTTKIEQRSRITIPSLSNATVDATMNVAISGGDLSADIGANVAGQEMKT